MTPRPADRIAAGYGDSRPRDRATSRAATFTPDPQLEQLAALRNDEPARWNRLSPTLRISVGYYEQAREAAAQVAAGGEAGG